MPRIHRNYLWCKKRLYGYRQCYWRRTILQIRTYWNHPRCRRHIHRHRQCCWRKMFVPPRTHLYRRAFTTSDLTIRASTPGDAVGRFCWPYQWRLKLIQPARVRRQNSAVSFGLSVNGHTRLINGVVLWFCCLASSDTIGVVIAYGIGTHDVPAFSS